MIPAQQLPSLRSDITDISDHLRCPISHTLMEDAVTATEGFIYARSAVSQWFEIRKSSPMTGLPIQNISLQINAGVCEAAAAWVRGDDLFPSGKDSPARDDEQPDRKRLRASNKLENVFDSPVGSFKRRLSPTMSLADIYKLANRGLKARYGVFQLSSERCGILRPNTSALVSDTQLEEGQHISVRIPADEPGNSMASPRYANDACLVKVYTSIDEMLFGFWVNRSTTTQTLGSVLWKYWRWRFSSSDYYTPSVSDYQVWTDMINQGDCKLCGNPQKSTDKLATYLTRSHCFVKLANEKVYLETRDFGSGLCPLVLKVESAGHTNHARPIASSRGSTYSSKCLRPRLTA